MQLNVTEVKTGMEKTLRWIVPLATNTSKWVHGVLAIAICSLPCYLYMYLVILCEVIITFRFFVFDIGLIKVLVVLESGQVQSKYYNTTIQFVCCYRLWFFPWNSYELESSCADQEPNSNKQAWLKSFESKHFTMQTRLKLKTAYLNYCYGWITCHSNLRLPQKLATQPCQQNP